MVHSPVGVHPGAKLELEFHLQAPILILSLSKEADIFRLTVTSRTTWGILQWIEWVDCAP